MSADSVQADDTKPSQLVEVPVYQSLAAYYSPISKKWQKGIFTLHQRYFEFLTEEANGSPPLHLSLPLGTVSSVKKKSSCFIYSAIVIEVGSEAHWFSSFQSRDSLFNLLELFWRDVLLSRPRNSINLPVVSDLMNPACFGKHLLSILHESQEILISTANALEEQGVELLEIQSNVEDMNADLSAAIKLLDRMRDLSVSFPNSNENAAFVSSDSIHIMSSRKKKKYAVTYRVSDNSEFSTCCWKKGFLIVFDNLQLLDEEENLRFDIPHSEIDSIVIVSLWEFRVSQTRRTRPGGRMYFSIMSPTLLQLNMIFVAIPTLNGKLVYQNGTEYTVQKSSADSSTGTCHSSPSTSSGVLPVDKLDIPKIAHQVQQVQTSGWLKQEEAQEILDVLDNLQTLASAVSKEQNYQMEKIRELIADIDKTDLRIKSSSQLMRRQLT